MDLYSKHMGDFDRRHGGMVEVNLDEDFELSPADFLELEGRFEYFCIC
jgi:hypothetical protein